MSNILSSLQKRGLMNCQQDYVIDQLQFLAIVGSESYGVSSGDSDRDLSGFCIPDKHIIFPHLDGKIQGFSRNIESFDQWQQHHIEDKSSKKMYDISIYSIVKLFSLLMENNPDKIDLIFVPRRCILYSSQVGDMVREKRRMFLHKGCWPRYKGYSYSQLHKLKTENPVGRRKDKRDENGLDRKFLYHVVRLLCEVEQILTEGDLDIERNREELKAIRAGERFKTIEEIDQWFSEKELQLEKVYNESKLPWGPDEAQITQLLLECLEHHFGSLDNVIRIADPYVKAVNDIKTILNRLDKN